MTFSWTHDIELGLKWRKCRFYTSYQGKSVFVHCCEKTTGVTVAL